MALAAAITHTEAVINAIAVNGLANGSVYVNTAMPSTSHVRSFLKWPLDPSGANPTLETHVCYYSKANLDTATRNGETAKCGIDTAVIIAVARLVAWKFYGWNRASLNPAEVVEVPAATPQLAIHAEHAAEAATALEKWTSVSARFMALFYYNAISYEVCGHHHLPARTKKLATTTVLLSGLKDWLANDAEKEGCVFHDCFHPLSSEAKSNAARHLGAKEHLSRLKFDNLRKRIPVKAADCGIALNYAVLHTKASAYRHDPAHLPAGLAPPANLVTAVAAYHSAADAAALTTAVNRLRTLSEDLVEPSAYLVGFILGREAEAVNDNDLDLRTAARSTTILGAPAYMRAAGEFSGTFTAGKEFGFKAVGAKVPNLVVPRCVTAVTTASTR